MFLRDAVPNHEGATNEVAFSDAMRECGAFVTAIRTLYGHAEALIAVDCWLEECRNPQIEVNSNCPMWRNVTIAAAARFARDRSESFDVPLPISPRAIPMDLR